MEHPRAFHVVEETGDRAYVAGKRRQAVARVLLHPTLVHAAVRHCGVYDSLPPSLSLTSSRPPPAARHMVPGTGRVSRHALPTQQGAVVGVGVGVWAGGWVYFAQGAFEPDDPVLPSHTLACPLADNRSPASHAH